MLKSSEKEPHSQNTMERDSNEHIPTVLSKQTNWEKLYFYQKADVVYQLSFVFCDRFIHLYKDRTRDQVIQAARSCKQNIVEGLADGITSTEMQLKLLNVARASLKELKEDFEDYIKSRHLRFYSQEGSEYAPMLEYCRTHNRLSDYEPFFMQWSDEETCNYGITLCHMIDKMMMSFLERLDHEFVTEGGIRERMYRARTGYRQQQDERLKQLEAENPQLRQRIAELEAQLEASQQANSQWQTAYHDLRQRALNAYNKQKAEIEELKNIIQRGEKN